LEKVTRSDHKASIVLKGKDDISTFDVNCGREGRLGLQTVQEQVKYSGLERIGRC
jgi:hypothetical protein